MYNDKAKGRLWIVDNFYADPEMIRYTALNTPYIEGGIGRGFIGRRSTQQFLFPGLKERFEQIMGFKLTRWTTDDPGANPTNGRFQCCWAGEPLVYHCDEQTWAGVIYLTPLAPFGCGTSLFAHRESRIRDTTDPRIFSEAFSTGTYLDRTPYETVDVAGNVFNRLVIWDASSIHSATEYFGKDLKDGRLFQLFFFD